jgi:hypothetical protein
MHFRAPRCRESGEFPHDEKILAEKGVNCIWRLITLPELGAMRLRAWKCWTCLFWTSETVSILRSLIFVTRGVSRTEEAPGKHLTPVSENNKWLLCCARTALFSPVTRNIKRQPPSNLVIGIKELSFLCVTHRPQLHSAFPPWLDPGHCGPWRMGLGRM